MKFPPIKCFCFTKAFIALDRGSFEKKNRTITTLQLLNKHKVVSFTQLCRKKEKLMNTRSDWKQSCMRFVLFTLSWSQIWAIAGYVSHDIHIARNVRRTSSQKRRKLYGVDSKIFAGFRGVKIFHHEIVEFSLSSITGVLIKCTLDLSSILGVLLTPSSNL